MVIIEEKIGDIFEAPEKYTAFAVNTNGVNDSGLAGMMFRKYPNLALTYPNFHPIPAGAHFFDISKDKVLCLLAAHTLGEPWDHEKTQIAINGLSEIQEPIAIVKIGTGMIGQMLNADWDKIRKMLENSPAKFVIYEKR